MSHKDVNYKFYEFGKFIRVVAIATILSIFPYISFAGMVLTFIFVIVASVHMLDINRELKNAILGEFRSTWLKGVIIRIIGIFILNVCFVIILGMISRRGIIGIVELITTGWAFPYPDPALVLLIGVGVAFLIGFIIAIVGASKEMAAWRLFYNFFKENQGLFPKMISANVMEGAEKCRTGALLFALNFLIITPIIGYIFQAIGYFKIASFVKLGEPYADLEPVQPQSVPISKPKAIPIPKPEPEAISKASSEDLIKFCPHCGEKVPSNARFCALCGSSLIY
ncbi:MAG: zinc-ribbon domain-containing protein [Candidatus Hermodarchaeota archaeon]